MPLGYRLVWTPLQLHGHGRDLSLPIQRWQQPHLHPELPLLIPSQEVRSQPPHFRFLGLAITPLSNKLRRHFNDTAMKKTAFHFALIAALSSFSLGAASPTDPQALTASVQKLFTERCGECHKASAIPDEETSPHFVDNLDSLKVEDINVTKPEDSKVYTIVLQGKMPKATSKQKAAGEKPQKLSPDECELVLNWIKATAGAKAPVATSDKPAETKPADKPVETKAAETKPVPIARKIVTDADVFAGALHDLLEQRPEDQADIRYLSLAAQHNNLDEINAGDLALASHGITKLLNSLSSNPKPLTFPAIGPEGVLRRIRLRELGWTAAQWDSITATYPYALDSAHLSSLAGPSHCTVPLVRADWFAAVASRPPFYDTLANIPKSATELEKRLGIDVVHNIANGDAIRSAFTHSDISRQNRLVEKHEIRSHAGSYWKSYDFKENAGHARIADFPLGPPSANLFGGAHAFQHAGGEIIFNLPNGFQAYMLANAKDERLDGPAPIEIVSDRLDKTRRADVANGLSCIVCHDEGMKKLPDDEIRALAGSSKFSPEEARLIEKLHPENAAITASVLQDKERFLAALKAAGIPEKTPREPVLALVEMFEADVTLAQAAAELGLSKADLSTKLEAGGGALFDEKTTFKAAGFPRVTFAEHFGIMAVRFGLGTARRFAEPSKIFVNVTDPKHVQRFADAAPIAVEIRSDKPSYRRGDKARFTVRTSEDCFLRLLHEGTDGSVTTLYPNGLHPDSKIKGSQDVNIPEASDSFEIEVQPDKNGSFGTVKLAAVVSNQPFADDAEVRKLAAERTFAPGESGSLERNLVIVARQKPAAARIGIARLKVENTP